MKGKARKRDEPGADHVQRGKHSPCDPSRGNGDSERGERVGTIDNVKPAHAIRCSNEDARVG